MMPADEFVILGIDADDGQAPVGELRALLGDVGELLVTLRGGACRDPPVVDAQPVVEALEDTGHGAGTDLDAERGEFGGDLTGGAARPANAGDGIAGDIVLQRRFDGGDHLGRFFQGWPPATGAAHALALDLPGEQLLASAGSDSATG